MFSAYMNASINLQSLQSTFFLSETESGKFWLFRDVRTKIKLYTLAGTIIIKNRRKIVEIFFLLKKTKHIRCIPGVKKESNNKDVRFLVHAFRR